jgi:hypothetical protein
MILTAAAASAADDDDAQRRFFRRLGGDGPRGAKSLDLSEKCCASLGQTLGQVLPVVAIEGRCSSIWYGRLFSSHLSLPVLSVAHSDSQLLRQEQDGKAGFKLSFRMAYCQCKQRIVRHA